MWFPHVFETQIVHHDLGTYRYTVVFLDDEIASALPFAEQPRLRISAEVADVPMTGAWQPSKGRWYLMLGKPLLKAAGRQVGDWVEIRFRLEESNTLELPEFLSRALDADPTIRSAFELQTIGKQRALAHRIASAKTAPTATKRVAEVVDALSGKPVPTLARLRLVVPDTVANP